MSEHRDEKHYLNDILESIGAIEIYLENMNYKLPLKSILHIYCGN